MHLECECRVRELFERSVWLRNLLQLNDVHQLQRWACSQRERPPLVCTSWLYSRVYACKPFSGYANARLCRQFVLAYTPSKPFL